MRQKWRDPATGHWEEVGDREDVAELLGKPKAWGMTFSKYSQRGLPKTNPAPKAVAVDLHTGRHLYVLRHCRAWEFRREGPGHRIRQ